MTLVNYGVVISIDLYIERQVYTYFKRLYGKEDDKYNNYKEWSKVKLFKELILREKRLGKNFDLEDPVDRICNLLIMELDIIDDERLPIIYLDNLGCVFIGYSINVNKLKPLSKSISEVDKKKLRNIVDEMGFEDLDIDFYTGLELNLDTVVDYEIRENVIYLYYNL